MTQLQKQNNNVKLFLRQTLSAIIAAHVLASGSSHAAPEGGVVVDGIGDIVHLDKTTRINQDTQRLSLTWDSFDVAVDERVEFVQPNADATALNRILDHDGSHILGQIDANGHVILMNPNGIIFGKSATVNVGGLVASGLNIDSDDFMNSDLVFSGVEGTSGLVVNHGLINASTGGNVALLGKSIANHGVISAKLGHVALAAGSKAVVTFDDQGLIGVRIDQETLASEVGGDYATHNSGTIDAEGGKVLLNASVSADLFSKAVNRGTMGDTTQAVVHNDGSFTLGAGNSIANTGVVNVSISSGATQGAGQIVMAGESVVQDGTLLANAVNTDSAGGVELAALGSIGLGAESSIEATGYSGDSGKIGMQANRIVAEQGAQIKTSGRTVLMGEAGVSVPRVQTADLYIHSSGKVDQVDKIEATGQTDVSITVRQPISFNPETDVDLTNSDNDFNTFALAGRWNPIVKITDRNDITLNDVNAFGNDWGAVHITSLGEGGTIRQAPNTSLWAAYIYLDADNIDLGANGLSDVTVLYWMGLSFSDKLVINGTYSVGIEGRGGFGIYGDDTDNEVWFGEHATADPFVKPLMKYPGFRLDLGGGDDSVTFVNDFIIEYRDAFANILMNFGSGDDLLVFEKNFEVSGPGTTRVQIDMGTGDDWLVFEQDVVMSGWGEERPFLHIDMGAGDDTLMSFGDFSFDIFYPYRGKSANIDMGDGDDWAIFIGDRSFPSLLDQPTLNLGQGDDVLFFRQSLDMQTMLGAGEDFVYQEDAQGAPEIVDFNPEEDYLITIP